MKVIVIGGGASGLMAAYAAAAGGGEVLLIEKNEKLGKKIYITGKGRCNLTNDCPPDEFLQNVVHGEKFLRGAVYAFPPQRAMEFFEAQSLPLKVERGRRVFPVSDKASDVTKALEHACRQAGVQICLNTEAIEIARRGDTVCGVVTKEGTLPADAVIVATGGLSYPSTGSTGDGYRFAQTAGHTLTPRTPSLVGIEAEGVTSAQGITVKNCTLTAKRMGKTIYCEQGELLFTHYGVSGPLILTLSALVTRDALPQIGCTLDFKPALDEKKLDDRLLRDFSERANEQMKNVMRGLLPAELGLLVLRAAQIRAEKQANAVTREERMRLIRALKAFPLSLKKLRGYNEAVITSGGVELSEVDPKTMQSKKVKGLYFCGEVLDVDAFTGGYNLQIAFATGFAAGRGAIKGQFE